MRLKPLITLLLIILFLSTFYTPGLMIKVAMDLYTDTASPYNIGWNGTSILTERLRTMGIEVVITHDRDEFRRELVKGGLLLLVASDYEFNSDDTEYIINLLENGTINIGVFDENANHSKILEKYGFYISGFIILDPVKTPRSYYPKSFLKTLNNSWVVYRSNIISSIEIVFKSINRSVYDVICYTQGLIDVDRDGKPDEYFTRNFITGVIVYVGNSSILIHSDSYPLTNDALTRNLTASNILLEYVYKLAVEKGRRVIIPNFLYRQRELSLNAPFHITILYMLLANYISRFDRVLTVLISGNKYLYILLTLLIFLVFTLLNRIVLNIGVVKEYSVKRILEKNILISGYTTFNLLNSPIVKTNCKTLINNYWATMTIIYHKIKGLNLDDILIKRQYNLLVQHGFTKSDVKKLYWLFKIYLKTKGKCLFPVVFRWRRTLHKYVLLTEYFLNKIGYTLMNKDNYRDATYLLK